MKRICDVCDDLIGEEDGQDAKPFVVLSATILVTHGGVLEPMADWQEETELCVACARKHLAALLAPAFFDSLGDGR